MASFLRFKDAEVQRFRDFFSSIQKKRQLLKVVFLGEVHFCVSLLFYFAILFER